MFYDTLVYADETLYLDTSVINSRAGNRLRKVPIHIVQGTTRMGSDTLVTAQGLAGIGSQQAT